MKMWALRTAVALFVEIAAADYLHLMQRRVDLSGEGVQAELLRADTPCHGVDCDLSRQARHVAADETFDANVDRDDVASVKFDQFFMAHKAAVEEQLPLVAMDEHLATSKQAKKHEQKQGSSILHVYPPEGEDYVKWSICNASFHSNLGGLGPDEGEAALRYFNVANVVDSQGSSQSLDLVVESIGEYIAKNVQENGLIGGDSCFGQINVKGSKSGTNSLTVHFNWYLAGTTTPVVISKQYLTLYDLDGTPKSFEAATFYNRARRVFTSKNTSLKLSGQLESGLTVSAEGLTDAIPTPKDPENLTDAQKDRAFTVLFLEKSQFRVTFSVSGGRGGRNFAFTGHSLLAADAAPPGDCEDMKTCQIYEDPHIKVFDGLQISLLSTQKKRVLSDYGAGDMWLVKSSDISIQGRYLPDPDLQEKNLFVRAVAIGGPFLNGSKLILGPLEEQITWNGQSILESQVSEFVANLGRAVVHARRHRDSHLVQNMTERNAGVDIDFPKGVKVTVNRFKKHVNVFIAMPPATGGQDGLCGNFNCRTSDDTLDMILRHRNPRVRQGESLFEN